MAQPTVSLQDSYLERLRQTRSKVTLKLVTGTDLEGIVQGYDNFTVVLLVEDQEVLVYKHALSSVIAPEGVAIL